MEGIIGVAVLFGLAYLLRRASSAFGKTVNQKVLFRSEHEEGLQLLQPAKYEVEATIPEVMKALMMHVDSQTAQPTGLNAVLYHSYNGADKIVYRLGNKLVPKTFETIITCNTTGSKTSVIFQITAWTESSGIIRGLEELSRLKKQVEAALAAAGAVQKVVSSISDETLESVRLDANFVNGNADDLKSWECKCGTENEHDALFCWNCGTQRA